MRITNGSVTYEHPYKIADFQIRKAVVALSFELGESEEPEAALKRVGNLAQAHAVRIAEGRDPLVAMTSDPVPAEGSAGGTNASTAEAAPASPKTRTRRSTAVPEPNDPLPPQMQKGDGWESNQPGQKVDGGWDVVAQQPAEKQELPPVTDLALNQACSAKAQAFLEAGIADGTQRIRGLIANFHHGDQTKMITALEDHDARREFLAQLNDLPVTT